MAEVFFFHLEGKSLDEALPELIEKTLARGWRAVVQVGHTERLDPLDQLLWTYDADSFIPHGTAKIGKSDLQPVYLTDQDENPNGASVRFMVAGAELKSPADILPKYVRVVVLFDGNDAHELGLARSAWKAVRACGASAVYWQQSNTGRWEKKA